MMIVLTHRISNPGEFWAAAQRELSNLPAGIKIIQVLPNAEGNLASCVQFAKNEYMAVALDKAMNVPHTH